MAEFLVLAKDYYTSKMSDEGILKLPKNVQNYHKIRMIKGDIVCVRDDGWGWGEKEGPPNFVVVQVPEIKLKDALVYEEPLLDSESSVEDVVILKQRKYSVGDSNVLSCLLEVDGKKEFTKQTFELTLTEKTLSEFSDNG